MRRLPLLVLVLAASCFGVVEPDFRQRALDEVARRETLWKGLDIHHYDFDFQRECNCSIIATQAVTIHVRNDVITRVVNSLGADVPPQADIPWPTVDSLFLWARQFLGNKAFAVTVGFDTVFNFPDFIEGVDPPQATVTHASSNLVEQTATAPIVVDYRMGEPFSKSNRVTWRRR